jgi:hypothetical protein
VRPTLDGLFAAVAGRIRRFTPAEALAADAVLVDIRSQDARERDGRFPVRTTCRAPSSSGASRPRTGATAPSTGGR